MQKSHSPQPRRTTSKYTSQPFKLPMNNLALPLTNSHLQSDQGRQPIIHIGQQSGKKIKQLLQINTRPIINPSKVQIDIDKLQIIMGHKQEKNTSNTSYSISVENTLKEFRNKIDEQDSIIRLQEFKINRLQSELLFQKQQYSRMMSKILQVDNKYNNSYPYTTKLTKSQLSMPQIDQIPQITKMLQIDNKKQKKLIEKMQMLRQENKLLKDDIQTKFKQIFQYVQDFTQQIIIQTKEQYLQKIYAIEQVFSMHLLQLFIHIQYIYRSCTNDYNSMRIQYDILNKELQLSENQKEVLYDKVISLL